jgi:hypothetical protein
LAYKNKADKVTYQRKWLNANPEKRRAHERKWRIANPEKRAAKKKRTYLRSKERYVNASLDYSLRTKYGITLIERDAIIAAQGACPTCGNTDPGPRGWHVDHCHATGKVRGILCAQCNIALGNARESSEVLRRLADYLDKHNK